MNSARDDEAAVKAAGVLLISACYPPLNVAGTARVLRFTRWLSHWGWRMEVVTLRPGPGQPLDAGLLERAPQDVRVANPRGLYPLQAAVRLGNRLLRRGRRSHSSASVAPPRPAESPGFLRELARAIFSTPDTDLGWAPGGLFCGLRAAMRGRPAWILSSGPPHTAHLIAAALAALVRVRWLADLRDPWSAGSWHADDQSGRLAGRVNRFEEKLTVRRADLVVLNTPALLDDFRERYPAAAHKLRCIPNGYDRPVHKAPVWDLAGSRRPLRITHAGSLYDRRDPRPLIEALAALHSDGRIEHGTVELIFVGESDESFDLMGTAERLGVGDAVRLTGRVPQREATARLEQSDVLLLIQPQAPMQVPSKLYDYVTIGKPVLALVDAGSTAELVRKGRMGIVVAPDDGPQIERALLELLDGDYRTEPDWDLLSTYSGEELSRRLEREFLAGGQAKQ